MNHYYILLFAVLLSITCSLSAKTWHIDPTIQVMNTSGDSWADPTNLANALFYAQQNDTIWVKTGVHYPVFDLNNPAPPADERTKTFGVIISGLKIFGGFAGDETKLEQRDVVANPTILSGEIQQDGDSTNNVYHVLTIVGPDNPIVDGFIIEGGFADGNMDPNERGAGVYMENGTIKNCIVHDNSASYYGGGVYCEGSRIENCQIINNNAFQFGAGSGGGIYFGKTATTSWLTSSIIANNTAKNKGAAIYSQLSTTNISNTTIVNNESDNGIYASDPLMVDIANSIIWHTSCLATIAKTNCALIEDVTATVSLHADNTANRGPNFISPSQKIGLDENAIHADWRLSETSSCIDQGNNSLLDGHSSVFDIIGNLRFDAGKVDIGAHEFQTPINPTNGIVFVSSMAGGLGDGSSWNNATGSIQASINKLQSMGGGEVWIKGGAYKPTYSDDRNATINISKPNIKLYGGFSGSETSPEQRSMTSATYLIGEIGDGGTKTDNSFHLITINGSANKTVLIDGFVITSGYAKDDVRNPNGAGIFMTTGTITNCEFQGNEAKNGGGVYYETKGLDSLLIKNCKFWSNKALENGGGLHAYNSLEDSYIKIEESKFLLNEANYGAGVYSGSDLVTITNSEFNNNKAKYSAAAMSLTGSTDNSAIMIMQNIITNNEVSSGNGAIIVQATNGSSKCDASFYHNTIVNNKAANYSAIESLSNNCNQYGFIMVRNIVYGNENTNSSDIQVSALSLYQLHIQANAFQNGYANNMEYTVGANKFIAQNIDLISSASIIDLGFAEPSTATGVFNNPTNWKINSDTSPFINSGGTGSPSSLDKCFYGNPRKLNGQYDIGAHEYIPDYTTGLDTIYIAKEFSGNCSGDSWANARGDLYNVLKTLSESADEKVSVWVAEGEYYPEDMNPEASFIVSKGMKLIGGFQGIEGETVENRKLIDLDENGTIEPWEFEYKTILSGNIGSKYDSLDNTYHIVTLLSDGGLQSKIEGFTIKGGYANPDINSQGGGIYTEGGAIKACEIINNTATDGGGVFFSDVTLGVGLSIETSRIAFNKAQSGSIGGGGIGFGNPLNTGHYSIDIVNSTISDNFSSDDGGGISIAPNQGNNFNVQISNSIIANNNSVKKGGGLSLSVVQTGMDINIFTMNNLFAHNKSESNGGGTYISAPSCNLTTTFNNNTFVNNSALTHGSAIYYRGEGTHAITNTVFYNNEVRQGNSVENIISLMDANIELTNSAYNNSNSAGIYSVGGETATETNCLDLSLPEYSDVGFIQESSTAGNSPTWSEAHWNITANSPLKDAGTSTMASSFDLAGNKREIGTIDIGAYENQDIMSPQNIVEIGTASCKTEVSWDAIDNPDGYVLYWSEKSDMTDAKDTIITDNFCTLPNLKEGTTYYIYAQTVIGTDFSEKSETISITTNEFNLNLEASSNPICEGDEVTITASGADSYVWGDTSEDDHIIKTPTASTIYEIVADDGAGCLKHADILIEVEAKPVIDVGGSLEACGNSETALIDIVIDNASSILWESAEGTFLDATNANTTFIPGELLKLGGDAELKITAEGLNVCPAVTKTKTISHSIIPQLTGIENAKICPGEQLIVESITGSGITSSLWSSSGSGTLEAETLLNPTYLPSEDDFTNGSVELTINAQGNPLCQDISESLTVTFYDKPAPLNIDAPENICEGANFSISTTSSVHSLNWEAPNKEEFSEPTVSIENASTEYNGDFTATYTDENNCSATQTVAIIVNTLPEVAITGPTSFAFCKNATDQIQLEASPESGTFSENALNGLFDPSKALDENQIIYSFTDENNCKNADTIVLTRTTVPKPVVKDTSIYKGNDAPTLIAEGNRIDWIQNNEIQEENSFEYTPVIDTYTEAETVISVVNRGDECTSETAYVTVSVIPCPVQTPKVTGNSHCPGVETLPSISAEAQNEGVINWYTSIVQTTPSKTGDSYNPSEAGKYYATEKTTLCESEKIAVSLIELPTYNEVANKSVEFEGSYLFGDTTLSTSGEYTRTLQSIDGCDSTVTLTFEVLPSNTKLTELTESACGSLQFNDREITQSGTYRDTFEITGGYDSIVVLTATIYPEYTIVIDTTIAFGKTFQLGDRLLSESGRYTEKFQSINSCDSIVDVILKVTPPELFITSIKPLYCENSLEDGIYIAPYGTGIKGVFNSEGNVVQETDTSAIFYPWATNVGDHKINFTYTFEGEEYTISDYLEVKPSPEIELGADLEDIKDESVDLQVKDGYTYTWTSGTSTTNSLTVEEDGVYYVTATTEAGCSTIDSVKVSFVDECNIITPEFKQKDITVCEGGDILLEEISEKDVAWFSDEALENHIHTGANYSPSITKAGVYAYYIVDSLGECESSFATAQVIVNASPNVQLAPYYEIEAGDHANIFAFTNEALASKYAFTWSPEDKIVSDLDRSYIKTTELSEDQIYTLTVENTLSGCVNTLSTTVGVNESFISIEEILVPNSIGLSLNKPQTVEAKIYPENTTETILTWKSSNTDIVTVSAEGIVTPFAEGLASVTVSNQDGSVNSTIVITVSKEVVEPTSINTVSEIVVSISEEVYQFNASVLPFNATQAKVEWATLEDGILDIDSETGRATLISHGTTEVIVSIAETTLSDTIAVTVLASEVPVLIKSFPDLTFPLGSEYKAISLLDYISDDNTDVSELEIVVKEPQSLTIEKDSETIRINGLAELSGSNNLVFTVSDADGNQLEISTNLIAVDIVENLAPTYEPVGVQYSYVGQEFNPISLINKVNDDITLPSDLTFSIEEASHIIPTINTGVLSIEKKDINWEGSEILMITITDEQEASTEMLIEFVSSNKPNQKPSISVIPNQSTEEDYAFKSINLNDYVIDDYSPISSINWVVQPSTKLNVSIENGVADITIIDKSWIGTEPVVFVAFDEEGLSSQVTVLFTQSRQPEIIIEGDFIFDFTTPRPVVTRNQAVTLFADVKGAQYWKWEIEGLADSEINKLNPSVSFDQTGMYDITFTVSDGENEESLTKSAYIEVVGITQPDTTICFGENITLLASEERFTSYAWNNGETSTSITVAPEETSYQTLTITDVYFTYVDSILLEVAQPLNLGVDTAVCFETSFELSPKGFEAFSWHNGSEQSSFIIDTVGDYSLTVTDKFNCVSSDTLTLTHINALPEVSLGEDKHVCGGETVDLNAGEYVSYNWNTDETSQEITVDTTGQFTVEVVDNNGCINSDTIEVFFQHPYTEEISVATFSESSKAIVVAWERTPDVYTEKYILQRESGGAGEYVDLVERSFTDSLYYVDNDVNSAQQTHRYRLQTIDEGCNASAFSTPHRTVHLTKSLGTDGEVNLNFTEYVGIDVDLYTLYRFRNGEKQYLGEVIPDGSNEYSFVDENYQSGDKYRVMFELEKTVVLSSLKTDSGPFSQSMSNLSEAIIENNIVEFPNNEVAVYPNPFKEEITFSWSDSETISKIQIVSLDGNIIMEYSLEKETSLKTIFLPAIPNGVYIARTFGDTWINETLITKH